MKINNSYEEMNKCCKDRFMRLREIYDNHIYFFVCPDCNTNNFLNFLYPNRRDVVKDD